MPRYEVTVTRTETIVFALDADSPEDADDRALTDGEELASSTSELSTERVELITPIEEL